MTSNEKHQGFSLVEVLVALTLLSVGVLATASGLAAVITMASEAWALTEVAAVATNRLERVRHEGCGAAGEEPHGPFVVAWGGARVPGGRVVTIAVRRPVRSGSRTDTLTSFQLCAS